ncbi:hypothetical protein E2562_002111 [Oryza meyeriana var. granulata]|uniref:Uncharacterized protein n=1 Tax=Oryza meyeriana var. granulata TaxID=110450 RepID=A0A6G1EDV9_9ORYZ|nr:hypothetical protein E2562_002111 [Oryza meyeriana var. granulata]
MCHKTMRNDGQNLAFGANLRDNSEEGALVAFGVKGVTPEALLGKVLLTVVMARLGAIPNGGEWRPEMIGGDGARVTLWRSG